MRFELSKQGGLQGGANPNAEDAGGQKPIHAAAAEQHRQVVEVLLPLAAPDSDSSADWTVDGIIQEAQQSVADDEPVQQQHQVHILRFSLYPESDISCVSETQWTSHPMSSLVSAISELVSMLKGGLGNTEQHIGGSQCCRASQDCNSNAQ